MMKKIIEMLCRQDKRNGSDGCRTDSLDKMDWDEFMDKCRPQHSRYLGHPKDNLFGV